MVMYFPPWDSDNEPDASNIKVWLDNVYGKFQPVENPRWQQGNIDTLFMAGEQRFINSYFNFNPTFSFQNFHFNIIQQPVNMITGYQRQHRKSINYIPINDMFQQGADDMTKLVTYDVNKGGVLEKYSYACEQSAIGGMVLAQPYMDFSNDPVNGTADMRIWSYNEFMTDPYWRQPDMSDCNVIWCQQFISKQQAKAIFPEKADLIASMSGQGTRYGKFYFLPENYNLSRNDLLVMSYVWYKSRRRKKVLYGRNNGMTYDFMGEDKDLKEVMAKTQGMFEVVEYEVPTWKLATVLNEQLMWQGLNPMGFDECPLVPIYWNRDPHIAQYDLRVRSLVRTMRDAQFLLNRRIILNHDISECSINAGWKRKENAVANPEVLKYSGQGKDVIIKQGYEMTDVEKLVPNAVPPSDLQLAEQLTDLIYRVSGVNQELMGMANDSVAAIEVMLRQGASLITLQKYFDQWDVALKLIGNLYKKLEQRSCSPEKIATITGKEAPPEFVLKIFPHYDVMVAEGINTSIQQQQEFLQAMQINEALGGIIPARFLLEKSTLQGKNEIIAAVDENIKQQSEMQQQEQLLAHTKAEAEIQDLQSRSVSNIAMARERHGRAEANIGLFEERLSEISQNRSMALKAKVEALRELCDLIAQYGQMDAMVRSGQLSLMNMQQKEDENIEKFDARIQSKANDQETNLSQNLGGQPNMNLAETLGGLL